METIQNWTRCGNTSYYRTGEGLNWLYIDPFNWQMISSVVIPPGNMDEGAISVIHRKAPYDYETEKHGVYIQINDQTMRDNVLRATHEWFSDLIRAKDMKMKDTDIKKLFQNAPKETQAYVLNGVWALMAGYEEEAPLSMDPSPLKTDLILVIPRGSKAEEKVDQIEELYGKDLKFTKVEDSVYEGLNRALAEFGIYEC